MSIEAIAALTGMPAIAAPQELNLPQISAAGTDSGAFHTFLSALGQLNQQLQGGEQALQSLALGGGVDNLHQSMMTLERTRLSLQLMLQVRNRALEAYQELTRMQV
jgi:flagellar hook-basal body complex protein FliE